MKRLLCHLAEPTILLSLGRLPCADQGLLRLHHCRRQRWLKLKSSLQSQKQALPNCPHRLCKAIR